MSSITLQGLTRRFGPVTAVEAVDLRIEAGELFFLLGPSGCGKTTILRMIAGFTAPTAGTVRFGERDVTALPPNRRETGMVFQSYALWPHLTVFENVTYGLRVRRLPVAVRTARTRAALRAVRMDDLERRKPNELSGGQQQRVALARALVVEPTVLLLDEPLSNLDARLRLEMRSEITRICAETGVTAVYVTHDQKEALSMAGRIAVLAAGRVQQVGAPRALYERPASRFVAEFLGETNLLPATVAGAEGDALLLDTAGGRLRSAAGGPARAAGGRVTLSVRPEALRVAAGAAEANVLAGRRVRSIYLGDEAQHLVDLPDGFRLKVLELNPGPFAPAGEPVRLTVDPADVVVLGDEGTDEPRDRGTEGLRD